MKRLALRAVPVAALLVAGLAVMPQLSGQSTGQPSTANGEWPMYTADLRGSKYSPLDEVNSTNFSKLEVAWRFKTDNLGPRPETKLEGTPIMVKGMLYATAGTRRAVVALDPRTGEQKWMYRWTRASAPPAGRRVSSPAAACPTGPTARATSGSSTSPPATSWCRSTPRPASRCPASARTAVVDLKVGIMINGKQADLEKSEIGLHSTPTVVGDLIIVGSSMFEGLGYVYSTNVKGNVRAFDARTGKKVWQFDTMPGPGQPGHETWEGGSWNWTGNTGVWTQITADPEAGLVYLPVESPTIDEYGGNRPGDNLFAESLVAVDLKTGAYKWHFQFVHHPIWDHDMSSAPLLIDTTVEGTPRKLVAVPSKQGWLYVFDRITGKPIWPIEERAVPQSTIPGEKTAKTQPFVDQAAGLLAHAHRRERPHRLHARAAQAGAREPEALPLGADAVRAADRPRFARQARRDQHRQLERRRELARLGLRPRDRHLLHPGRQLGGHRRPLRQGRVRQGEPRAVQEQAAPAALGGRARLRPAASGRAPVRRWTAFPGNEGRRKLAEGLDGLPIVKPPYGVMAAIDLKNGSLLFQVPHGDTPDAVRDNPLLKGMHNRQDRPERQRRRARHQDAGHRRRPAVHRAARTRARRDAARLQQADRRAGRRSAAAGAGRRHADDLLDRTAGSTSSSA